MEKKKYPKMVYKSREDYKQVDSIDQEEELAKEGYGSFEIVVLGKKPEEKPSEKSPSPLEKTNEQGTALDEEGKVKRPKKRATRKVKKKLEVRTEETDDKAEE